MTGDLLTGDLKENTITFEVIGTMKLRAGRYFLTHEDELVKIENAYIEDAYTVGSYDVTGRVKELWITKSEFDKVKSINN